MERPKAGLSDYLAAERTFLAWIRTGLALMGFGFVVARFGFFLQELRIAQHIAARPSSGISTWLGTALVVAGVIVNVLSAWQHARLVRRLGRGETSAAPSLSKGRGGGDFSRFVRIGNGHLSDFRPRHSEITIRKFRQYSGEIYGSD